MTKPTTISAITDTPAKTPSPIGNTSSFLPGVVAAASCAAAADGVETEVETWPFDKVVTTVTGVVAAEDDAGAGVPVEALGIWFGPTTDTAGGAA